MALLLDGGILGCQSQMLLAMTALFARMKRGFIPLRRALALVQQFLLALIMLLRFKFHAQAIWMVAARSMLATWGCFFFTMGHVMATAEALIWMAPARWIQLIWDY
jgi:hypothetical protein